MKEKETRVIFRVFKDGEIIALFPDMHTGRGLIGSYMHIGQHGDASPLIVNDTKLATREQYEELYKELVKIGYCLNVCKKITRKHIKTYLEKKCEVREAAQNWQNETSNISMSWGGVAIAGAYFEKMAKRYGLLQEFKENGII